MIQINTGQPGNGKTLYTLWAVEKLRKQREKEGVPTKVYFHGIKGLKLPWSELADPEKWFELEAGSIVVIDEAQKIFRVRSQGSKVPQSVAEMETHRHGGIDLFLITQHPHLIDTSVRKLAGRHVHIVRRFGFESAMLWQWEHVQSDPLSDRARKDALKTDWKYPKVCYSWYESAEVHTVRKDFPIKKLAVLAVGVFMVFGGAVVTWRHIQSLKKSPTDKSVAGASSVASGEPEKFSVSPWDASRRSPRVKGVDASAPYYDVLQRPSSQPSVAGCSKYQYEDAHVECSCYTQQNTKLSMSSHQCLEYFAMGFFDPNKKPVDQRAESIAYLNAHDSRASQVAGGVQQTSPKAQSSQVD